MAILRGGGFSEGSLLRRTLLHVATFALGSLAFVGLLSFILVSVATSLLPSHGAKASADTSDKTEAPEADGSSKPAAPKLTRPKRPRAGVVEEESPNHE